MQLVVGTKLVGCLLSPLIMQLTLLPSVGNKYVTIDLQC